MSGTEAIAEVFATAFRALPDSEKSVVIERLLREEKHREPEHLPHQSAIREMMEHPVIIPGFRAPSRDEMHDGR